MGLLRWIFEREESGEVRLMLVVPMSTEAEVMLPVSAKSVQVRREGSEVREVKGDSVRLRHGSMSSR